MDDNVDARETHQFVPMNCFDLNELSQEDIIIFILFVIYNSYDMILIFFFCFHIVQVDDDLILSEIHGSVSKNCVELNELRNDGKKILMERK